jgi:hypothetical protein
MRDAWIDSLVSRGTVTCQPNTVGWGNLIRLGPCASAPGSMKLPRCSTTSARTAPLFCRERSNAALQLLELPEAALFFPYAPGVTPVVFHSPYLMCRLLVKAKIATLVRPTARRRTDSV